MRPSGGHGAPCTHAEDSCERHTSSGTVSSTARSACQRVGGAPAIALTPRRNTRQRPLLRRRLICCPLTPAARATACEKTPSRRSAHSSGVGGAWRSSSGSGRITRPHFFACVHSWSLCDRKCTHGGSGGGSAGRCTADAGASARVVTPSAGGPGCRVRRAASARRRWVRWSSGPCRSGSSGTQ